MITDVYDTTFFTVIIALNTGTWFNS